MTRIDAAQWSIPERNEKQLLDLTDVLMGCIVYSNDFVVEYRVSVVIPYNINRRVAASRYTVVEISSRPPPLS